MSRIVKLFIAGLLLLVVATPSPAWAYAFNINANTASLNAITEPEKTKASEYFTIAALRITGLNLSF